MRIVLWENTEKGSKVIELEGTASFNDGGVLILTDEVFERISFDKIRYIETENYTINFEKR